MDASGPYVSDVFWGAMYRLAFVDDFTRVRYIVPVVDRTWVTAQAAFLEYSAFIHYWSGYMPAGLTCDQAPEYVGADSLEFTDEAGMQRLLSIAYEPRTDGVAESTWRHTDPRVRATLGAAITDSRRRARYFMLASVHVRNYVMNREPTSALPSYVAPMTVLAGGRVQSLKHSRIWGCQVTVTTPVQRRGAKSAHHMDDTGRLAMHVGVCQHHKGYVVQYQDDGSFEPVINCSFQEDVKPMLAPPAPPPELPPPAPLPPLAQPGRIALEPPAGVQLPPFPPPMLPVTEQPEHPATSEGDGDGDGSGLLTPPPTETTGIWTPPTVDRRAPMPDVVRPPADLRTTGREGEPWRLPGTEADLQPRRPGSRVAAEQRFAHAAYVLPHQPFAGEAAGEVDPDELESYFACVDYDGCPIWYESCVATFPSARASAAQKEAKVRFFETPQGVHRLEVPRGYSEAMRHERAPQLFDAMCREMSAQWEKSTHHLVKRSDFPGAVVLPLGWVYDFKVAETQRDGILDKARLIGYGNYSEAGKHFFDKAAGVARASSLRTEMAFASQYDLTLTAGDVPTAYLNAMIHDVIILSEQPPGFERPGPSGEPARDMICRWTRALYGWVLSAFEWAEEFREWLEAYGFKACPSDVKVFVLVREVQDVRMMLIVGLHVDDLLMGHSHPEIRTTFLTDCPYKIKDLGAVKRIVGGDVVQDIRAGTVHFSVDTYLRQVARRFEITETAHAHTPTTQTLVAACRALDDAPGGVPDAELQEVISSYQPMTGVALFVTTLVRVEAAFPAHYATTRLDRCGQPHLRFIRHLLAYFINTKSIGLTYKRSDSFNATGVYMPGSDAGRDARLHGIGDAAYVLPRSVGASVVMMGGAAAMWRVTVQRQPSISPGEAEFYALTNTITETVTIRQLVEEFGHIFTAATEIFSDASTARSLARFGAATPRTRFIHRRYHFARFYEEDGVIRVLPVKGVRNPANMLTKFVFGSVFVRDRRYLLGILHED